MNDLPAREDVWDWMKERDQWRLWSRKSNPPKKPLDANGTGKGWNDPACWLSFEEAYELAETDSRFDGIGFVVSKADPYYGIDVDGGLREPNAEKLKEWVPSVESLANETAMQFSTSGTGFHAFGEGSIPEEWWSDCEFEERDHEGVEAYEEKFFIVTGRELSISADEPGKVSPSEFLYEAHKAIEGEYPREQTEKNSGGKSSEWSEDQIKEALSAIDSDCGYAKWRNIGFAVYDWDDGATGKALFESWSRGSGWDSDSQRHIDNIWSNASEGSENDSNSITVGTLIYHAQQAGWSPSGGGSKNTGSEPESQAATDGGAAASSDPAGGSDAPSSPSHGDEWTLDPGTVKAKAELGEDGSISDLIDRVKAAKVWEIVSHSSEVHVRVRRDTDAIWEYDEGVWDRDGKRALRHAARKALSPENYGANVLKELKAQARSDPGAEVPADRFGLDPGQVAVENGLLDLEKAANGENGAIRELRPSDYALTQLPVEYDPDAGYEEWQEYVEEWAEDGRADALQEYVGYCLHVNEMPIHRALLLVGSGANGKGTFLHVVRQLLGEDNTTSIELQTLANERDAVADFYGAVANIDDDLSARKLGAGLGMFKKLVGGDNVRARHLYEDGFEFQATGKHLYAANEVPDVNVPDDDEAFWRRWLLVEFPNHYPPEERDGQLKFRLSSDEALSGVLNWAIEGWQRLKQQGYFTNEDQYAAEKRSRWQSWGDSADKFIEDCLERDEDAQNVSTQQVHRRYAAWCRENNHDPIGQQKLTNTLKNENFDYGKRRVDGVSTRGFGAMSFADEVPDLDETPERESGQTSL